MVDLIRELINQIGSTVGILSLLGAMGFTFLYTRQEHSRMRHTGLCNYMVDAGVATYEKLVRYGAVDDPSRLLTFKEVLTS